jgi:hypothetical protein
LPDVEIGRSFSAELVVKLLALQVNPKSMFEFLGDFSTDDLVLVHSLEKEEGRFPESREGAAHKFEQSGLGRSSLVADIGGGSQQKLSAFDEQGDDALVMGQFLFLLDIFQQLLIKP